MTWYVLNVNPEPWAVGPLGYRRSGGKMSAYIGQNAQLKAFQEAVAEEIGQNHQPLLEGKVQLVFLFWRDRAEYTSPQARLHRKHEADLTNMVKATEDALQGILFKNDRDNNEIRSAIVEQGPGVTPRIVVGIAASGDIPSLVNDLPDYIWEKIDKAEQHLPFEQETDNSWPPKGPK